MKLYVGLLLASLLFITCKKKSDNKIPVRIDFFQAVQIDKEVRNPKLKQGKYITFKFYQFFYRTNSDTSDYSRSLRITIPLSDTSFFYQTDSTHFFEQVVSNCRGLCSDFKTEPLNNANITGRKIATDKWHIVAETKYFNFKRFIHIKKGHFEKETIFFSNDM
ncbi:hypothetical protein [Nibribacter koreensis]|uniref:Lipoprotein n=1 Tax=Nibribacter koreensis TaxID=1084519 RepID=A0ABP8FMM2_9BACT